MHAKDVDTEPYHCIQLSLFMGGGGGWGGISFLTPVSAFVVESNSTSMQLKSRLHYYVITSVYS